MQVELALRRPKVRTYPVHSSGLAKALLALERHGWWGRYEPRERMTYVTNERGRVETVLVDAEPEITLPALASGSKLPSAGRRAWSRMVGALLKHERQHHRFFVEAARAWKRKLEARPDLAERAVQREWDALVQRAKRLQRAYDRRTRHGRTEGVVLELRPPAQRK
jgi:predicted secreted Zn-dependent protease